MNNDFRDLLHVALGKKSSLGHIPTDKQWRSLFAQAEKQALLGVCFAGIENLPAEERPEDLDLLMDWMGLAEYTKSQNLLVSKRAAELTAIFAEGGFRSIVLKGQGIAQLYRSDGNPRLCPQMRNSGDIDLWVDGERAEIIAFLKSRGIKIGKIFIHHIDAKFFDDVEVEVHCYPSFSYNPLRWSKYRKWFAAQSELQFAQMDKTLGFGYPTIAFNAVYSLLHIFRHVFQEGIGLRHLLDYYFILQNADANVRSEAMATLKCFGLERFAAAVMWVEQQVFASDSDRRCSGGYPDWLLCEPDAVAGQFLLDEIISGGNFGQFADNTRKARSKRGIQLYFHNIKHVFKMVRLYPSEVLWSPLWKPAHWVWREIINLNSYE